MSESESLYLLAQRFESFAERECTEDALYVALCRLLARRPDALRLLLRAPAQQQRPNLLLAALHARVLAGGATGLAAYYASAGGRRPPDAGLEAALDGALRDEHAALAQLVAHHSTQTNEIGRCAVLWPSLMHIGRCHAGSRLALLDFGCSAGLNLGVGHYHYDYGDVTLGATAAAGTPHIACRWIGPARPDRANPPPRITQRLGVDPAPVSVHDAAQVDWLRACLWPGDRPRAERLDQAVAIAQRQAWPVERHADCAAAIEPWLDRLPGDVLPVVFNSWVLAYLDPLARQRHIAFMHRLVQSRRLVWVSAEHHGLALTDAAVPAPASDPLVADDEIANGSLWWAVDRTGAAALARSHPHGRWMQWLAEPPAGARG